MKEALRNYLLGKSDITALVGSRIYSHPTPQGSAYPRLIIQYSGEVSDHHLTGATGLKETTWKLEAHGLDEMSAAGLQSAVRLNLDTYRGPMGAYTVHSTVVYDNDMDEIPVNQGSQDSINIRTLYVRIRADETLPKI